MAKAPISDRLRHMLSAIVAINRYISGKTFDDYRREPMLRHAVERNLEIVSEASRHLPDEVKARRAAIPWRAVAAIGNVLRHAYDEIIDERVWQIVTGELAPLKAAVLAMIAEGERKAKG